MGTLAHRLRVAIAVALVGLLAAAGALWAARTALTERALVAALAARGVAPVALRVERLDGSGLGIEALAIDPAGAPDLAAARVEADWSWAGLRAGRLDALRVTRLRLRATLGEAGLSFGALDPLLAGPAAPAAEPLPPPPVAELVLDDARLLLSTPEGVAEVALTGAFDAAPGGAVAGGATLALEHPLGAARGRLELEGRLDALAFRATLDGHAARAERRVALSAQGRLEGGALRAEWELAPLVFVPGALQPAALYPPLARLGLRDVAGRVEARGQVRRDAAGAFAWSAGLALRELAATAPLARVEGLHAALALAGPPLHTETSQLVAIGLLDVGVPLTDGLLEGRLRRDGALALRSARFRFAGGTLEAGETVVDPRRGPGAVTLRARGLELARLLEEVALAGLAGSGQVEGELPLVREGEALVVRGGVLRTTAPGGTIRYAPAASVRQLAASRPYDLGLAIEAFSDFRYETLEARIDGDLAGTLTVDLHVRGANPAFQDGRPVELDLTLEARLADLVRAGQASYRVPAAVEERLRAFSEGRAPP
ncbi:MAG: YdbH domain-containing protein [Deltaproteobacteria bacterium]|nr:YdbH domain-containing protein [Deltaproteobacteria bacterium]